MRKGKNKGGKGFLVPLIGRKQFKKEMGAATRLEFGPLQRQLEAEQRAALQRSNKEIPAWYDEYRTKLGELRGSTASAYETAGNRLVDFLQASGEGDANVYGAMADANAQSAALRGATADGGAEAGGAQAASLRRNLLAQYGGTQQAIGANQANYYNRRGETSYREQEAARGREQGRQSKINADLRELAARKGAFRTDYRRQARADERAFYNELRATSAKRDYNDAMRYQAYQSANKTVDVNNNYSGGGKGGGKGKGYPDSGNNNWRGALGALRSHWKSSGHKPTWREAIDYLMGQRSYSLRAARRAATQAGIKPKGGSGNNGRGSRGAPH